MTCPKISKPIPKITLEKWRRPSEHVSARCLHRDRAYNDNKVLAARDGNKDKNTHLMPGERSAGVDQYNSNN